MDNPETLVTLDTQDTGEIQTNQKVQHRKLKRWATRTPPKSGWIQVLVKGKEFLLLKRHPKCYSYNQSSQVKIVAVTNERKNLRKK